VPDFNDEDFPTEDPVAYVRAIRQRSLEHLIAMEELKELQQQLSECYYREGVNYLTKCRPLVEECSKRLNQWRAFVPPKDEETDSVIRMRH